MVIAFSEFCESFHKIMELVHGFGNPLNLQLVSEVKMILWKTMPQTFSMANSRWKSLVKAVVPGHRKKNGESHKQRWKTGAPIPDKGLNLKMIFQAPNSHFVYMSHTLSWGHVHRVQAAVRRSILTDCFSLFLTAPPQMCGRVGRLIIPPAGGPIPWAKNQKLKCYFCFSLLIVILG